MKKLLSALLAIAACMCQANASSPEDLIKTLDESINARNMFVDIKGKKISMLCNLASKKNYTESERYNLNLSIIDEYYPFSFDSTLLYLKKNLAIASKLKNKYKTDETLLKMCFLYVTSGNYMEAKDIIQNQIDTSALGKELLYDYYKTLHRFARELIQYSKSEEVLKKNRQKIVYYREKMKEMLPVDSNEYLELLREEAFSKENFQKADSLLNIILSRVDYNSHDYAIYAYKKSLVREALKDKKGQIEWLARSANMDMRLAVMDYASLCTLAIILVNQGDVDRAFKYIQLSLKDALFYNAKLRPWQVAETMPFIEKEYENKRNAQAKRIKSNFLLINILTIILLISFIYIIIHYLKLKKAQKQLKDLNEKSMRYYSDLKKMNEGLKNLNEDVTEANKVKEQYIALYLSILSAHIDKLRDYMNYVKKCLKYNKTDELEQMLRNSSSILEKEVDDFYKTFDSSFLTLYPNFVDEFNSLLNEGADLTEIKKGEMLNTELRIFALIRLGIKDSSTIASLLRYSVNTIYNYRAKVKNFAKDRNHFEDQIDMIGSFRK
ncbi:MAG: DUF6377 domain-containing protein [Bacteroidales bacterium]|jgi:hypothetical protein|nr:DUF6377 domain-containing protein [Bacteroidales bacterium]